MRRMLTSGERCSMQNEEGAKDSLWESTGLWDREKKPGREGMKRRGYKVACENQDKGN